MMKKIGIPLLIVLALFLVFRDFLIKQVIVSAGTSALGAKLEIDSFSLSLLTGRVKMKDVKLYNPENFSNKALIDLAHVDIRYNAIALATGKLYFPLIDLDIRQLAIEHNKDNQFNVASLKIKAEKSDKPLDMRIDELRLNVDKVTLRDDRQGIQAKETNYGVGLQHKVFRNITSPQQLIVLVLFESSGLSTLKNMGMSVTKEVLGGVKDVTKNVAGEAKKTVNSLIGSLKSVVK